MPRREGGGREFDPEYTHFRECMQGYWGKDGSDVDMASKPESPENKDMLGLLMRRKGIINAGGVDKAPTSNVSRRRNLQGQILLDIAWNEIHGYKHWHELSKEERSKYQYKDESGHVRYHRPNTVYEAAGVEPQKAEAYPVWVARRKHGTYVTHFKGKKLKKSVRVKEWAPKNKDRINEDKNLAFGIRQQKPYTYTTKKGTVVHAHPNKWYLYDKKSGKLIRWIGA